MGILNIGTLALQANQVALQTIGNNIANANTVGYSRQSAVLATVAGQYTGAGYVGKGVNIQTIQRNYDEFLTRQSTLATSTQAADVTRSDYLKQLSDIFQGGSTGMGAAVNDMLNAFSDVASAPTDQTARTVALTRIDETARRMRAASQSLDDLQIGITKALGEKLNAVNTLAKQIAAVNGQIALAQGGGQPPNDLLDKRDQLIRDINQYVQTTSVKADDGSVGLYIGGSQSIVLGNSSATLTLGTNEFGDAQQNKVLINRDGNSVTMDENRLGGGEISGLLRFQNNDMVEGRNLLGRLTTAVTTSMNDQHKLGLDLDGVAGTNLFTQVTVNNLLVPVPPATTNTGAVTLGNNVITDLTLEISDTTKFVASDYLVTLTPAGRVSITRVSDGTSVPIDPLNPSVPVTFDPNDLTTPITFDGLTLKNLSGANPGDRFYLKPFSTAANNISREFSSPRALAVASPIVGKMGANNTGSLQLTLLKADSQPTPPITIPPTPPAVAANPVMITFGPNSTYKRDDEVAIPLNPYPHTYTSGTVINNLPANDGINAWSLTLQGVPKAGDTFTVVDIKDPAFKLDPKLNGGNATNMMNLRDAAMFDGAAMSDGYASLIAQIGIRSQSANYSATVSTNIATNSEKDRTGIAGVNMDEEAAKLIQYQQAYQASAKMIQIAQSIFDTLIQTLGR
jgi:flagellar hook-associated protein 1 FlgK